MRRHRVVGLVLLATLVFGACSAEDRQLAQAFIQQWAIDHAGEITMHKLGLSDGDSYVDAAVDAADVVMKFQKAEDLMAKGRRNSDPKSMDAAMKLRPNDWTYELSRANLALELGDMEGYWENQALVEADSVGVRPKQLDKQDYAELLAIHKRLDPDGYDSYEQCRALYNGLAVTSGHLAGNPKSTEALSWRENEVDCEMLPH